MKNIIVFICVFLNSFLNFAQSETDTVFANKLKQFEGE